ncbi:hypothetical protein [Streptomyces hawaiiensis]|uniref:hypothetical protein n=1 Tax=Streptomyces hawaiiensis TaxID=67305 RepID=UPI003647C6BC
MSEVAGDVQSMIQTEMATALTRQADWPHMAQQLVALRQAGVDLSRFLPEVAEIAATSQDSVLEHAATSHEGKWERKLRETLPAGPVREAIVSSPRWPEMTAAMERLEQQGVDVRSVLATAHDQAVGVHHAVAQHLGGDAATATSRDALLSYGPLTVGLDIPKNLNLDDREGALEKQLAISPSENQRYVWMVRQAMPDLEREADLLVAARQWPLIAARIADMERGRQPVAEHLARLSQDTSWQEGPQSLMGRRLVQAANDALRKPIGAPAGPGEPRARVNTAAARSTSPSVGPLKAAARGAAPVTPGVAAHREAGPAAKSGRRR